LGKVRRALSFYEQALVIATKNEDRLSEANARGNIANAIYFLGDTEQSKELQKQVLNTYREIGDKRAEGRVLWNMSLALYEQGKIQEAMSFAETAQLIFERAEDPNAEIVRCRLAEWRQEEPTPPKRCSAPHRLSRSIRPYSPRRSLL
jgi:tetratricopeptide (TPR) repeat protein